MGRAAAVGRAVLGLDRRVLIGVGLLAAAGLFVAFGRGRDTSLRHITAAVKTGDIRDVVQSTGTVSAVVTVQVGSQVSGTIARLNADFNSRVHRRDIIAEIDPSLLRGVLLQASADVETARASVAAADANVTKENANLLQVRAEFDRQTLLMRESLTTQQAMEQARAAFESQRAATAVATAGAAQARAQVRQKEAALQVAQTNLDHTVIRSPIDGIVVARNVDVGQTVAASLQAPTIFTIAQDLRRMLVYAKIDESDVGRIRLGHPVNFKVDAFPDQTFQGTVSQIRMNPTMVQNVVTYDAIIEFANPDLKLFPGMTAYVTIPVATAEHVLSLPNSALHYRPPIAPDEVQALYHRFGIAEADHSGGRGADTSGQRGGRDSTGTAIVWKLRPDNSIEPVQVSLGITDHAFTQIRALLKGSLKDGDQLVTRSLTAGGASPLGGGRR